MSDFEQVTGLPASPDRPALGIYYDGKARLNKRAVDEYFEGVDHVSFYVNREDNKLGISLGDKGVFSRRLSDDGDGGRELWLATVLREFGIHVPDLENSAALPIENDPEEGLLVVDLEPFMEANDAL